MIFKRDKLTSVTTLTPGAGRCCSSVHATKLHARSNCPSANFVRFQYAKNYKIYRQITKKTSNQISKQTIVHGSLKMMNFILVQGQFRCQTVLESCQAVVDYREPQAIHRMD